MKRRQEVKALIEEVEVSADAGAGAFAGDTFGEGGSMSGSVVGEA